MPLRNGKLYLKRPPKLKIHHLSDNVVIITNSYQQELPDAAKAEDIDQSRNSFGRSFMGSPHFTTTKKSIYYCHIMCS